MADLGLLGVGSGVVHPSWVKEQALRHAKKEQTPVPKVDDTEARDSRLIKEAVTELDDQTIGYEQTVDLASINANTTVNVDITVTTVDKVRTGDYVLFAGAASLNHGLVVQGGIPAPANDIIRLRISNLTAAAIDAAAQTFYFVILRSI